MNTNVSSPIAEKLMPDWLFDQEDNLNYKLISKKNGNAQSEFQFNKEANIFNTPHLKNPILNTTETASNTKRVVEIYNAPIPLLLWADRNELWQNMIYKEEVNLKLRKYEVFKNGSSDLLRCRSILIDWVMEVCSVYTLRKYTYYLAIDYIDRFLSTKPSILKNHLQLLGVTSLFVASKIEEIYPPKLESFVYLCDGSCNKDDILKCEILLLNTLNWDLNVMTASSWLNLYMQIYNNNKLNIKEVRNGMINRHFEFSQYSSYDFVRASHIMDLFSMDISFVKYSYSIIAAAVMYYMYDKKIAIAVSGKKWKNLKSCVSCMAIFNYMISKSSDICLLSVMSTTEDDKVIRSYRVLKNKLPNITCSEDHLLQMHVVDYIYFKQSIVLRLQLHGFLVKQLFVTIIHDEKVSVNSESSSENDIELYEVTPKNCTNNNDLQVTFYTSLINVFETKNKVIITFNDMLYSICNKAPSINVKKLLHLFKREKLLKI